MNKWIGVGLAGIGTEVFALTGTAVFAAALQVPGVAAAVVAQVALRVAESRADAVLAVGLLGAVESAAAHLGSEVGTGDTENLLGHNVVDALLQVRNLLFETCEQPLGNLAQKDATFAAGVEESRLAGMEQLLR